MRAFLGLVHTHDRSRQKDALTLPSPGGRGFQSRSRGFTLLELVIAMAIFVIGFTVVAALFPVAATLQRQTAEDLAVQSMTHNVRAMLEGRKFQHSDINAIVPTTTPTIAVTPYVMTLAQRQARWSDLDTSFPSTMPLNICRWFWEPVLRRTKYPNTTASDWQVFVFCLRATTPGVRPIVSSSTAQSLNVTVKTDGNSPPFPSGTTHLFVNDGTDSVFEFSAALNERIRAGDQVLDQYGVIYNVIAVDSNAIKVSAIIPAPPANPPAGAGTVLWFAPGVAGKPSPNVRILCLTSAVE